MDWRSVKGPWNGEPDFLLFSERGFPCVVLRHANFGHLNGYVGVPRGHPLYRKSYRDLDVRVHGGLSYSGDLSDVPLRVLFSVLKYPDVAWWWFGFDCAHAYDVVPAQLADGLRPFSGAKYRDVAYVQEMCRVLARRLWRIGRNRGTHA